MTDLPERIQNVNAVRKREKKPPLTKQQIEMVEEQRQQRERYGRFSLLPQKDKPVVKDNPEDET